MDRASGNDYNVIHHDGFHYKKNSRIYGVILTTNFLSQLFCFNYRFNIAHFGSGIYVDVSVIEIEMVFRAPLVGVTPVVV